MTLSVAVPESSRTASVMPAVLMVKTRLLMVVPLVSTGSRLFFFSSRRRHTRLVSDWSSDVCSSDLHQARLRGEGADGDRHGRARGRTGLQRAVRPLARSRAEPLLGQPVRDDDVREAPGALA